MSEILDIQFSELEYQRLDLFACRTLLDCVLHVYFSKLHVATEITTLMTLYEDAVSFHELGGADDVRSAAAREYLIEFGHQLILDAAVPL